MTGLAGLSFGNFFSETGYVGRIYADSLRDNFVGYVPLDPQRFSALEAEFRELASQVRPSLAELLRIEAALVQVMPDEIVMARFWAIEDRFRRVLPTATCDRYDRSVEGRGDARWQDAGFVRRQTLTLLDAIHANYLINIGREKSIKRLKIIMAIAGIVIAVTLYLLARFNTGWTGYLMLAGAGVFGSFLSITNRMQSAISVDAMTQDGIYELTGLRVGWVGILMSFVLGGGFALVLYGIVLAGLLQVAMPSSSTSSDAGQASSAVAEKVPAGKIGDAALAAVSKSQEYHAAQTPPGLETRETKKLSSLPECTSQNCGPAWALTVANSLGFARGVDLFKMLVLAVLAGFAERLVPDILNRLSKQQK